MTSSFRMRCVAFAVCASLLPVASSADVLRDGSIGSAGPGSVATAIGPDGGSDFLIGESDGERAGGNLFHTEHEKELHIEGVEEDECPGQRRIIE